MKYNKKIVVQYFRSQGIPEPVFEHKFCDDRKWRFDVAFVEHRVAVEIDGGIWIGGGHNRGAQIKKTWEKENEAQIMGWKILKCEPEDLCLVSTTDMIKRALENLGNDQAEP